MSLVRVRGDVERLILRHIQMLRVNSQPDFIKQRPNMLQGSHKGLADLIGRAEDMLGNLLIKHVDVRDEHLGR